MNRKLNQVLAIEKGIKQRVYATITELDKIGTQSNLFNGFSKTYEPKNDQGTQQPPQSQKVAYRAEDVLDNIRKSLVELFDVTATKDWGNQSARANVEVDGELILASVPATYLLFLDKQLTDMRTAIGRMTELDATTDWKVDETLGLFKTEPSKTHTTAKVQEPLVLYPATDKHPAQTQVITKDVIVGEWTTTKYSGAIPAPKKKALLDRIQKLIDAVKTALEEANMTRVDDVKTGNAVLSYIFGA